MSPTSVFTALAEALAGHVTTGAHRTRSSLPGGFVMSARSQPGDPLARLQVALLAPSPAGASRICTARFEAGTPLPAITRLLSRTVRSAPPVAAGPASRPTAAAVAAHLTVGIPERRLGEPGLFVSFGHATAWLHEGRLSVTLGGTATGGSLTFLGPWDGPAVASVTDGALEELTGAHVLAAEVSALLPPAWNQVFPDQWHPDAAILLPRHSPGPGDPLGRVFSRELRAVGRELLAVWPELESQPFYSNEGAAVALRLSLREREVPKLVKTSRLLPPRPGDPVGYVLLSEYLPPGFRRVAPSL